MINYLLLGCAGKENFYEDTYNDADNYQHFDDERRKGNANVYQAPSSEPPTKNKMSYDEYQKNY